MLGYFRIMKLLESSAPSLLPSTNHPRALDSYISVYHIPKAIFFKASKKSHALTFCLWKWQRHKLQKVSFNGSTSALFTMTWISFFFFFSTWCESYVSSSSLIWCELWSEPKVHASRIFNFGRYFPKHTGTTETPETDWNGIHNIGIYIWESKKFEKIWTQRDLPFDFDWKREVL